MKKHLSTLLKIAVTLIALALVLPKINLKEIGTILLQAKLLWVLAGFGLFIAGLFLRAYRWLLLLHGLGVSITFWRLAELYFIGNFFNMALPSGFGGDVVRVVEVAQDVPTSTATGTVILDRLTGLIMLFVMGALIMPFQSVPLPPIFRWIIIGGAVGGIIGGVVLLEGSLLRRFGGWLPGPLSSTGNGPVAKLLQAVQGCGWQAVGKALSVSFLFNLMLAGWWVAASNALGQSIPYLFILSVMPLLAVPLLIPSIGGLGPRETLVPILFETVGVAAGTAVAISLLVFAITRASGLLGAPLYLYSLFRKKSSPKELAMNDPFLTASVQPRESYLKTHQTLLKQLAEDGQHPKALFVTCSDSRIMPEQLLGLAPGDMFMLRNIANIIPPVANIIPPVANIIPPIEQSESGIISILEYAILKLHVPHIIICGHTQCGGIQGLDQQLDANKVPAISRWLEFAQPAKKEVDLSMPDLSAEGRHLAIVEQNVLLQLNHLKSYPFVQEVFESGNLTLHGWVYHLDTQKIKVL